MIIFFSKKANRNALIFEENASSALRWPALCYRFLKKLLLSWRDSKDGSAAASYPADPGSNLVVSTLLQGVISDRGIFNPDTRKDSAGFDFRFAVAAFVISDHGCLFSDR